MRGFNNDLYFKTNSKINKKKILLGVIFMKRWIFRMIANKSEELFKYGNTDITDERVEEEIKILIKLYLKRE